YRGGEGNGRVHQNGVLERALDALQYGGLCGERHGHHDDRGLRGSLRVLASADEQTLRPWRSARLRRFFQALGCVLGLLLIAGSDKDLRPCQRPSQGQPETQVAGSSNDSNLFFTHASATLP